MPLLKTCSIEAFQQNLRLLIKEGRDEGQAYAIAQRLLEEACKAAGKPVPQH